MSHHIYTDSDLETIKTYNMVKRVYYSNSRFSDNLLVIDLLNAFKRSDFKCTYCKEQLDPVSWQLDHFHAKARGGKNEFKNLAPSCRWCNIMKNALSGDSFLLKCKKIFLLNLDTDIPSPTEKGKFISLKDFPVKSLRKGKRK
jgi:hypothetical protein